MTETKTRDIWQELRDLGLIDANFEADNELTEWLTGSQDQLEVLINTTIDSDYIENLTFDALIKMPYDTARKTIENFSMKKRIEILDIANARRDHYYSVMNTYGEGIPKDEQLSATEFRSLLSKIKHIEILQNWLYGIV